MRYLKPLKIDFYILSEIIGPFFGGVLFFVFVSLMFQLLRLADFFIIHGVAASIIAKMTALMVISFLPIALPVAFLIAVLVGFGRLSADSELVAMKASGVSIYRMTVPAAALSLVIVALSLGLNMQWVPWGERTFKSLLVKVGNTKVASSIKEGTFTAGFFDMLIFVDKVDPKTKKLNHVFIYDERESKQPMTVVAKEGQILSVLEQSELGSSAMLKLFDGNIHRNDVDTETYQRIDFSEYRVFLRIQEGVSSAAIKPKMLPYKELGIRIKNPETGDRERREMRAELLRRYTVALSPLIFVFLGVGFGTVRTRAVRSGAILVAFLVIVVYWSIQAIVTSLAHEGVLNPSIGMHIPNAIMAVAAAWSFKKSAW